jgi:signal transduction histidine kinase
LPGQAADDGIGFNPAETPRGHIGLVGMRQRAERIGADFAVSTRPGAGTVVSVAWKLATGGTAPSPPGVPSAE